MDALKKIFNRLTLIMEGEAAIRFADAEVFRILVDAKVYGDYTSEKLGSLVAIDRDGDGMLTVEELADISSLSNRPDVNSSVLAGNTTIEIFDEFRYFTKMTFLGGGMFQNCISLKSITLPNSIKETRSDAFSYTVIKKLVIPEGCTDVARQLIAYDTVLELVDLPSTLVTLGTGINRQGSLQFRLICRATTPPTFDGAWWDNSNKGKPTAIYVPDESIDTYKTASGWSKSAGLIHPLSEYVEL